MKFAAYVAWILLYICCKFGEKICNNSRDIEFFLGDYYFLARPVQASVSMCIDETVSENLLGLIAAMISPAHLVISLFMLVHLVYCCHCDFEHGIIL